MEMSASNIIETGSPKNIHLVIDDLRFFSGHVEKGMLSYCGHLVAFQGDNCSRYFAVVDEGDFLSPVEGL
jgi:hypothetical protein